MVARTEALINPAMIVWALERQSTDSETLADMMGVDPSKVEEWVSGSRKPTFRQAETIAKKLNTPFGFLFLDKAPNENLPLPDLRTIGDKDITSVDPNTRDLIYDVTYKHEWFKEYLLAEGAEPLPFVGSVKITDEPSKVARLIRETLARTDSAARPQRGFEERLRNLMRSAEEIGIWVLRSGIVENNTHRPLPVETFRGFAIADPIIPLVFINGRDALAAQIFTFLHEVAHIWLGESGISNANIAPEKHRNARTERFCNKVAAEFLVPERAIREGWATNLTVTANSETIASDLKVSSIVVAKRAADLGMITREEYSNYYRRVSQLWGNATKKESSGGDISKTLPIRYGSRFTNYVLSSARSGNILLRDAADLLHVKPRTIDRMAREVGTS
jgi:Zn-dependent peptidase ImmA (M78 family)